MNYVIVEWSLLRFQEKQKKWKFQYGIIAVGRNKDDRRPTTQAEIMLLTCFESSFDAGTIELAVS